MLGAKEAARILLDRLGSPATLPPSPAALPFRPPLLLSPQIQVQGSTRRRKNGLSPADDVHTEYLEVQLQYLRRARTKKARQIVTTATVRHTKAHTKISSYN